MLLRSLGLTLSVAACALTTSGLTLQSWLLVGPSSPPSRFAAAPGPSLGLYSACGLRFGPTLHNSTVAATCQDLDAATNAGMEGQLLRNQTAVLSDGVMPARACLYLATAFAWAPE